MGLQKSMLIRPRTSLGMGPKTRGPYPEPTALPGRAWHLQELRVHRVLRRRGPGLRQARFSARDRTIRTLHIRVRSKFFQNSGIFARKFKIFGKFQH